MGEGRLDSIIVGGLSRFRGFDPNLDPPRETDSRTETRAECVNILGVTGDRDED